MTKKTWTDVRVAVLEIMWAQGKPSSEIAKVLGNGISRNSVIGAAHRRKLEKRVNPCQPRKPTYIPVQRPIEPVPPAEFVDFHTIAGMPRCKYIEGDRPWKACGKHCMGSWCSEHDAVVYASSQPRTMSALKEKAPEVVYDFPV